MAEIRVENLQKSFGSFVAVRDADFTVGNGEFFCLLGPSGCGKTTTLRLIAGFLGLDAGAIRVGERVISAPGATLPPEQRNMSMIFQSYALWPHMTIAENVAYGLKLRRLPRGEVARRVDDILGVTRLAPREGWGVRLSPTLLTVSKPIEGVMEIPWSALKEVHRSGKRRERYFPWGPAHRQRRHR